MISVVMEFRRSKAASKYQAFLEINDRKADGRSLTISENSMKVDGIGGIVWDGSLVMIKLLSELNMEKCSLFELGCGTGLCGIYAATKNVQVILSDREIDLALENIEAMKLSDHVQCIELTWGRPLSLSQQIDIIIGCECTCLVSYLSFSKASNIILEGQSTT
jgi:hypothetical protein